MASKEELEKKYMEFQELNQEVKTIKESMNNLGNQLLELKQLEESLNSLDNTESKETFISLGSGIFTKATLEDSKDVLMNVGSNILVKKKTSDSKKLVTEQIQELQKLLQNMEMEFENVTSSLQTLHQELQEQK
jgi:prefoldin alpha subunit|tara:strand:- start:2268 stop:2669 length:402 start_codon:yes stop_codon:yes gene_type:complete